MTDEQHQKRLFAAHSAVGSVEAEGLNVDSETLVDLQAWVRGEVTIDELLQQTLEGEEAKYGPPTP
jgi:hypothetical protein